MPRLDDLVEFAANPDPRCPCLLLLDTSGSMEGERVEALNQGLRVLEAGLKQDALARRRVEVAIITFGGGVRTVQEFVTAEQLVAPILMAGGDTPMGEAIGRSLDLLRERKRRYRDAGIPYYRPWLFMITDGAPTDSWQAAAQRVRREEGDNGLAFFAVGVAGADLRTLERIAVRTPLLLRGLRFADLFLWLSQSQRRVSASRTGELTALPPAGWAAV